MDSATIVIVVILTIAVILIGAKCIFNLFSSPRDGDIEEVPEKEQ